MKAENFANEFVCKENKFKITSLLIIPIITSLLSCSSVPSQIYSERRHFSKCSNVALHISCSEFDVRYARDTDISLATSISVCALGVLGFGLLPVIAPLFIEGISESHQDKGLTKSYNGSINKSNIEKLLEYYFLEEMKKTDLFKISYSDENSYEKLLDQGYDTIVKLNVEELSLKRGVEQPKKLYLFASVWGEMVDLHNKEVFWKRHEIIKSKNEHTIDEFKAEDGKLLIDSIDNVLKRTAIRLSSDIIYSK